MILQVDKYTIQGDIEEIIEFVKWYEDYFKVSIESNFSFDRPLEKESKQ